MAFDADAQANGMERAFIEASQVDDLQTAKILSDIQNGYCKLTVDEQDQTVQALLKLKIESHVDNEWSALLPSKVIHVPEFDTIKDGHGSVTNIIFRPNRWGAMISTDCQKR